MSTSPAVQPKANPFLRGIAHVLSVLTHPLLQVTYILLLLLAVNPYLFGVNTYKDQLPLIALVFGTSFLIPLLVVLMMRGLEMISDIMMPNRKDRTIAMLAVGTLYLGLFAFCRQASEVPVVYTALVLGSVSGLFAGFFVNQFSKVSLHALGMGGFLGAIVVMLRLFTHQTLSISLWGGMEMQLSVLTLLILGILLAGAVGTARLILEAHRLEDVFGGFMLGFVTMGISVLLYF